MTSLKFTFAAGLTALATLVAAPALAEYPERPVTIIVPWGAGGGTDTIIRIFAVGFEKELGQPINVINRTGGSGVVGHSAIANSTADGYTLGACTSEITYFETVGLADINPASYDLISRLATIPAGVTVAADSPYGSIQEVVEAAKSGELSSSGSGLGGPWHMAVAGMMKTAGASADTVKFIPSKGGAPALQDLVSGGISMFTGSPIEARALADAGEVKILGIMADERSPAFPDVPTLKESGVDWSLTNWFSLCAPSGLPEDIKAKIETAAEAAHGSAAVQDALAQRGITPLFDGSEAFSAFAAEFSGAAKELLTDLGIAK
ncbi:tripartite tricarboxylate transporter substrate binding protein [Pelagibius litoralis]|uniref:Tripartite tricarboxylate transporter substrate binding protein n=1 Tax=Pelagibius litoralis TaxID=374515 RepID=A0A967KGE3_9PROT|nr:tripartite tricarboxylate transporter substrate binding protein [Pelagibius litoralis]NIA72075.1 tripartite tricarboxylate transporter substrate binding protein [Pelagibius litoralis]